MKKLLSVLTLGFTLVLSLGLLTLKAAPEEGAIDIYPYDQEACSLAIDGCVGTKVGRSNWVLEHSGYRMHFVRGSDKYVSAMTENAEGFIDGLGVGVASWSSFGKFFINNTENDVKLKDGDRTALTSGSKDFIYAYFDENGIVQKIEDAFITYHIVNDNHDVAESQPDWRLANALEIEDYTAAEEKPANMLYTTIRIIRDSVDENGYVLEPMKTHNWVHKDYDPETNPVMSTLVGYDPNEVHIPAGWKVMTIGFLDRSEEKPKQMIMAMVASFEDETPEAMNLQFTEVPPTLAGFGGLDKNPYISGVQIVAKYGEPFVLEDADLASTWVRMFDDDGKIINKRDEKIDFDIIISQDGVDLETITYTFDGTKYTASGPITKVKTDKFEEMYDITMKSVTPKGVEGRASGIIVVGVLPNRFEGVQNHFIRDGVFIDLLQGVKAFNGNDVDITDKIEVSWPENFNPYNPQPGKYTITLDVAHDYHWPAVYTDDDNSGSKVEFVNVTDPDNPVVAGSRTLLPDKVNVGFVFAVPQLTYIDYDHKELLAGVTAGWGTVFAVVNKDTQMVVRNWSGFDGYRELHEGGTTPHADAAAMQASVRAYELKENEYLLAAHGTPHGNPLLRNSFGQKVNILWYTPAVDYKAEAQVTYQVTVDDRTAPQIRVVNGVYKVDSTMFETPDDAILANVVAFDNFSAVDLIVDDAGGLDLAVPGDYTVTVTAEDKAANSATVTFTVTVVKARLSDEEVAALLNEQKDQLQAIINQQKADLEAVIAAQKQLILDQQAALEGLQGTVEEDAATKAEMQEALNRANAAATAAAAAQATADAVDAKPDKVGAPIWMVIVFTLIGAGIAFGASFLVLGRKK